MFNFSKKGNNLFGIEGYDIVKKYCDPLKNIKEREFLTQKKGQKNKGKILKKFHEEKNSNNPAPNAYNIVKPWVHAKEKRSKSVIDKAKSSSKNTYIDQIFSEAKRTKSPGPGAYEPYGKETPKAESLQRKLKMFVKKIEKF